METLKGNAFPDPFPHLILENFYNEEELNLVWEELKFYIIKLIYFKLMYRYRKYISNIIIKSCHLSI